MFVVAIEFDLYVATLKTVDMGKKTKLFTVNLEESKFLLSCQMIGVSELKIF